MGQRRHDHGVARPGSAGATRRGGTDAGGWGQAGVVLFMMYKQGMESHAEQRTSLAGGLLLLLALCFDGATGRRVS